MILTCGVLTYISFLFSLLLFLIAIASTPLANDPKGQIHVENLLTLSLVFMAIFLILSIGLMLLVLVKSVKKNNIIKVDISENGSQSEQYIVGSP